MKISDVLEVLECENLPPRVRCVAQALYIAMLALDRYGHTMSYDTGTEKGSEVDHDRGYIARNALEDIRVVERRVH